MLFSLPPPLLAPTHAGLATVRTVPLLVFGGCCRDTSAHPVHPRVTVVTPYSHMTTTHASHDMNKHSGDLSTLKR